MVDELHLVWMQGVNPVPLFGVQVVKRPNPVGSVAGRPVAEEEGRVVDEMDEASRPRPDREVRQCPDQL